MYGPYVKEADGMVRMHRLLAICLALAFVLMLGSPPVSIADGPRDYSINSGPTDGGDGHPWDDGTGSQQSPGDDDPTDPQQQDVLPSDPVLQPALMPTKGIVTWTQRSLVSLWYKVREIARAQKTATKPTLEYKTKQSRTVQH